MRQTAMLLPSGPQPLPTGAATDAKQTELIAAVEANNVEQPLTDAQLRATPLPVPDGAATEAALQAVLDMSDKLAFLIKLLRIPAGFDMAQNRARGTTVVESGTITTVTTVTTCSTVSALNNIDIYQGRQLVAAQVRDAWANTVGRRFS